MIKEDLIAERIAISVYRNMIEWFGTGDPTTRRMLEDILKDEEDHADELSDLLSKK
jgi:bacterioferritin